ncbi:hypothetical protein Paride_0236 [Pseudomonas phage Paride]|nr:hypothetical protein Deiofobo_0236 [Pseudomonas phage Deifobo]WPK39946.1 hypothetical protein ETTORE_0237 [Pseudomonas phage Ettore]WPK40466.1 hypothetical protein Paride_0236 [Pseudomonas phage Paride]
MRSNIEKIYYISKNTRSIKVMDHTITIWSLYISPNITIILWATNLTTGLCTLKYKNEFKIDLFKLVNTVYYIENKYRNSTYVLNDVLHNTICSVGILRPRIADEVYCRYRISYVS